MKKSARFFLAYALVIGLGICQHKASAQETSSKVDRGLLSLGASGGIGNVGFATADGNMAQYDFTGFGIDMDIQLIRLGSGEIRLWGSFLDGKGEGAANNDDQLTYSEVAFGLKFYPTSWIYLGAGAGNASADLDAAIENSSLSLSFPVYRASLGFEFAVFDNFYVGLDIAYRNGHIEESQNSSLDQNSFAAGQTYFLKLLWCPPFTTINFSSK